MTKFSSPLLPYPIRTHARLLLCSNGRRLNPSHTDGAARWLRSWSAAASWGVGHGFALSHQGPGGGGHWQRQAEAPAMPQAVVEPDVCTQVWGTHAMPAGLASQLCPSGEGIHACLGGQTSPPRWWGLPLTPRGLGQLCAYKQRGLFEARRPGQGLSRALLPPPNKWHPTWVLAQPKVLAGHG